MNNNLPTTDHITPDPTNLAALASLARERTLRNIAVPTSDTDVRSALRRLHEPITLFGEDPALRRDRLRRLILARQEGAAGESEDVDMDAEDAGEEQEKEEEFYTEAGPELLEARKSIARWSLKRSARAVAYQRAVESKFGIEQHREVRNQVKEDLRKFELWGSQTAPRPVSVVCFPHGRANPSPDVMAVADWSGEVRLLGVPDLETRRTLRGHRDKVRGLAWHPESTGSLDPSRLPNQPLDLATGGSEGSVHLWSLNPSDDEMTDTTPADLQPLHTIQPPLDPDPSLRAIRALAFHPSSEYLAVASEDTTFHLYSLHSPPVITPSTTSSSNLTHPPHPHPPLAPNLLSTSDAHAHPPHTLTFSPSGSLLLSAGADAHGRIWDLRTGRTIMLLSGHMREIHGADWAPDGVRVVTGAADGLAIVWDVRMVREVGKMPVHRRGVTDVRWFRGDTGDGVGGAMEGNVPKQSTIDGTFSQRADGEEGAGEGGEGMEEKLKPSKAGTYILTCGFDREVAFTSPDDGVPIKRLQGHNGHVLSCDVSGDGRWVGSGGYDRTVKVWGMGS